MLTPGSQAHAWRNIDIRARGVQRKISWVSLLKRAMEKSDKLGKTVLHDTIFKDKGVQFCLIIAIRNFEIRILRIPDVTG